MINSKKTYQYYLEQDRIALEKGTPNLNKNTSFLSGIYFLDSDIWKFQKCLRKVEYLYNVKRKNPFYRINKIMTVAKFKKLSVKLGFTIPPNVFGPGLRIVHRGTIVVNGNCKIGANCTIHVGVNIGAQLGTSDKVPVLGDYIYIAPGAKLFGAIELASGSVIGANAVVNKSFLKENSVLVGAPARLINSEKK